MADVVIYSTNFGATTSLPDGWTYDQGEVNTDWHVDDGGLMAGLDASTGYAGASGRSNMAFYPSGADQEDSIRYTSVNCSVYKDIRVRFAIGYATGGSFDQVPDTFLQYSTNGGSSFHSIPIILTDPLPADGTWEYREYPLPNARNQNVIIRFNFNGKASFATYVLGIDDVSVIGDDSVIEILDTPARFTPANNDIVYVVSGTNNIQSNYKYWCDVWFAGSTTYDYRLFAFPRPDGFGFFNLKTILRDFVSGDINPDVDSEGIFIAANSFKEFSVQFGESYNTGSVASGDISDGSIFAYNASLNLHSFIEYSQNDRVVRNTGLANFLSDIYQGASTDFERYTRIGRNEKYWLYLAIGEPYAVSRIYITTYDTNGNTIGIYYIRNDIDGRDQLLDPSYRFIKFPAGTQNINTIIALDFIVTVSGTIPIITDSVAYYEIKAYKNGSTATTNGALFKIEENCSKYTPYRIHYRNRWGGFDSFTFSALSRENVTVDRKSYKKNYGSIDNSGAWSVAHKERGITNYSVTSNKTIRLVSDWITEYEYNILTQLIESPQVFYEDQNEFIYAVNIVSSSYEVKTLANNKLINLEIEVEFTQISRRK